MLHSVQALKRVEEHLPEDIEGLSHDQAKMIEGAITYSSVTCDEVMTSVAKINFTLDMDSVLTCDLLQQVREIGYSRIPIVENGDKNKIIAVLLTKSLIGLDSGNDKTVRQLFREKIV
jgi:CBS domain containing-hemolysin-like protein